MKHGHHRRKDKLYIADDFIDGYYCTENGELNEKTLLYVFDFFVGCVNGVQHICAQTVAIHHIEKYVTFDSDPFLFQD